MQPAELQDMVRERVRQRLEERPDNQEMADGLRRERARVVRLKEMRLEGEFDREEYLARKAELTGLVQGLEGRLGLPEYDAEAALARMADAAQVVRAGDPVQQRRALGAMFERIEVSVEDRQLARVVPRRWFELFFKDLSDLVYGARAWRDSNPRSHRFEVCGSIH